MFAVPMLSLQVVNKLEAVFDAKCFISFVIQDYFL